MIFKQHCNDNNSPGYNRNPQAARPGNAGRYTPALPGFCGQIERKAGKHKKCTLVITIA